jgi:hypothetical protein
MTMPAVRQKECHFPNCSKIADKLAAPQCWGAAFLAAAVAAAVSPVQARDLYEIRLTLPETGESGESSFSSADEIVEEFEDDFAGTLPAYTDRSIAEVEIDFRGVPFSAAFPTSGTPLRVRIPQCGFDETFVGATRDDSINLFEDFFEENNDDLLTCVAQSAVANSPVDPVAGNPNSLMGRMAAADFDMAFDSDAAPVAPDGSAPDVGRVGLQFGHFSSGEYSGENYTIPLRYTVNMASGYGIIVDAPINILSVSGSQSYSGSFGVGVRIPVTENWTVTPTLRGGAVGSIDFASAAFVYSGGASSLVSFSLGVVDIDIGNMVQVYQTGAVSAGDYESDYDLTNYVSRHGAKVTGDLPFDLFGWTPNAHAGVIRTDFFGDELFIEGYTDLIAGVSIPGEIGGVPLDRFRLGLTYTIGDEDYNSIRLGGAFRF